MVICEFCDSDNVKQYNVVTGTREHNLYLCPDDALMLEDSGHEVHLVRK